MSFTEDLKTLLNWLAPPKRPSPEEEAAVEATQRRELARREDEAHQRIAAYPRNHWQPLLDLIPERSSGRSTERTEVRASLRAAG